MAPLYRNHFSEGIDFTSPAPTESVLCQYLSSNRTPIKILIYYILHNILRQKCAIFILHKLYTPLTITSPIPLISINLSAFCNTVITYQRIMQSIIFIINMPFNSSILLISSFWFNNCKSNY